MFSKPSRRAMSCVVLSASAWRMRSPSSISCENQDRYRTTSSSGFAPNSSNLLYCPNNACLETRDEIGPGDAVVGGDACLDGGRSRRGDRLDPYYDHPSPIRCWRRQRNLAIDG